MVVQKILIFISLLHNSSGCNKRTIVLRGPKLYREKCVGCGGGQADEGNEGTLPPPNDATGDGTLPPSNDGTEPSNTMIFFPTDVSTQKDIATGPDVVDGATSPVIPIGDCKCGQDISWDLVQSKNDNTTQLNRPWMVRFRIQLENKEHIECSGSLINRRWIISAAHCFCPLNEHIECGQKYRGFNKELAGMDRTYGRDLNTRINMTFGSTDAAYTKSLSLGVEIEKIIIHPDYWEDKTKHGNAYDLALIKTYQDIYPGDGLMDDDNKVMLIHPICLPPYGAVDWAMTRPNYTDANNQYPWLRKDSPRIPFEDMDCVETFKPETKVPTPTNVQAGWLKCHPDKFANDPYDDKDINIMGRNSFITGFGSLAHPLTLTGQAPHGGKRVCRSNQYSPGNNVFTKCKYNRCLKDVDNPSLNNALCKYFQDTVRRQTLDPDTAVVLLTNMTGTERSKLFCYPWDSDTVKDIKSYKHKPYSGGWCDTCKINDENCKVTAHDNWGWCVPGCDGSQDENMESKFRKQVHELPVDSFVYENCSVNVDTMTEFCTGSAITQGKMMEFSHEVLGNIEYDDLDRDPFNLTRIISRQFSPGDIGWNGNSTIIRPGARYQGRQHSSYEGDSCFGDAGGSVWKYWVFRDPASGGWDKGKKLAVLTGVISRFEEMCGAFSPWPSQEVGDEPNLPTQHTVHARVQNHLDWIARNVFSEGSCG